MSTKAPPYLIRRPVEPDWPGIMAVLRQANFHRLGEAEMPVFPLQDCFVAEAAGQIVGVAGYRFLDGDAAKTTLLAVDPSVRGSRIGDDLQAARLAYMRDNGARRIFTNTDDERVVRWACRRYGFRRTGRLTPKVHEFGNPAEREWIELVLEVSNGE